MNLAFAGTPEFALVALRALHQAGHHLCQVLTRPDQPAGRGMQLQASPVKIYALAHAMPLLQPRSLRLDGAHPQDAKACQAALQMARPEAMIVAAYGLILPQWLLDIPTHGCLNIHASLLPRWRGAAPIQRAIEAGDAQTGISIMRMDAGLDTGALLHSAATPIGTDDSSGLLHQRLAAMGAQLMLDVLRDLPHRVAWAQPAEGVTYAHKIAKAEAWLDWHRPAAQLALRLRAFDPFPGGLAQVGGQTLKIWAAKALAADSGQQPPGTILQSGPEGIDIATGAGILRVTQMQRPGGKRQSSAEFVQGFKPMQGQCFVVPAQ